MWIADNWKDLLDTSLNGESLRRWGDYILVKTGPSGTLECW